jgi:glycosyltransferase involved in cell wall biosynthesis
VRRVFHLVTHLRLGAGRYIVDLAIEQQRQGHTVSVGVSDDAEDNWKSDRSMIAELDAAGVRVASVGDTFHRSVANLRRAASRLQTHAASWSARDIVHTHTAMGSAVARWAGAPAVACTCHGWNPARPQDFDLQDAMAFNLADGVTSPSTYWAKQVMRLAGLPAVPVLRYGFDLERYPEMPPIEKPSACRPRIVCVAELTARKGQDILIAAMPIVWQKYPLAELHLIGDGDMRDALQSQAHAIDSGGRRITFHGFVEKPYSRLGEFDIFCLPTRSDNQPVAIVEAMLAGLPVVATNVGGIQEQVAIGNGGLCVAPDDVNALADALITSLKHPVQTNSAARARFDIRGHARRMEDWYASMSAV